MLLVQLVVIQIIIFGVVFYMFKKILYGDTESAVNRLDKTYKDMAQKKQEMADRIFQMQQEYDKKKEEGEKLAGELKDKAEKEMTEKRDETLKKAREEAERIVTDAQNMKLKIREEIRKEEENNAFIRCGELLDATLKGVVREKMNEYLVEDFLKEFDSMDASHIPSDLKEVEVVTALEMSPQMKVKISDMVYSKMTNKPPIKETADPSLLGGIILKFGSLVLDGSMANKLKEKLYEKMV